LYWAEEQCVWIIIFMLEGLHRCNVFCFALTRFFLCSLAKLCISSSKHAGVISLSADRSNPHDSQISGVVKHSRFFIIVRISHLNLRMQNACSHTKDHAVLTDLIFFFATYLDYFRSSIKYRVKPYVLDIYRLEDKEFVWNWEMRANDVDPDQILRSLFLTAT